MISALRALGPAALDPPCWKIWTRFLRGTYVGGGRAQGLDLTLMRLVYEGAVCEGTLLGWLATAAIVG